MENIEQQTLKTNIIESFLQSSEEEFLALTLQYQLLFPHQAYSFYQDLFFLTCSMDETRHMKTLLFHSSFDLAKNNGVLATGLKEACNNASLKALKYILESALLSQKKNDKKDFAFTHLCFDALSHACTSNSANIQKSLAYLGDFINTYLAKTHNDQLPKSEKFKNIKLAWKNGCAQTLTHFISAWSITGEEKELVSFLKEHNTEDFKGKRSVMAAFNTQREKVGLELFSIEAPQQPLEEVEPVQVVVVGLTQNNARQSIPA